MTGLLLPATPEDLRIGDPSVPIYEPIIQEFLNLDVDVRRVDLEKIPTRPLPDNVVLNLRNKINDLNLNHRVKVAKRRRDGESYVFLYKAGVRVPE